MSVSLAYRVVDVFSDRPLAGNALCVVLDACPISVMGALAREVNLSETSFPVVTGANAYDVRIFTPSAELPFAGHPTLGTAWTLGPGRWNQTSPGATVTVEADTSGARMRQPEPNLTALPSAPDESSPGGDPAAALGLSGTEGCWLAEAGGLRHLLVPTTDLVDQLAPDLGALVALSRALEVTTIAVVRRLDDATLHVRVFAPIQGITEDPGTGSAAGPLATLAHRHWGTDSDVTILQGAEIGRPCRLEVSLGPEGPSVGGRVTACAEGRFTL